MNNKSLLTMALAALGLILLVSGFITYSYKKRTRLAPHVYTMYPYKDLAIPLIILGVIIIIVAAVLYFIQIGDKKKGE